jgi:hypothetical protein
MATVRPHERRRFSRITFRRPATLTVGGGSATAGVLDVSLKGVLLEIPPGLEADPGAACTVRIHLDAGEQVIQLEGDVAHRQGVRLGVRCTSISLESIAHLRRVVELSLADEGLLHRELATLMGLEG